MNTADVIRDFSSLPPEAQKEVVDFIAFLKTRHSAPHSSRKRGALSEEPFIGMWKDREEMRDSSAWVRDMRRKEWNPKP